MNNWEKNYPPDKKNQGNIAELDPSSRKESLPQELIIAKNETGSADNREEKLRNLRSQISAFADAEKEENNH